jgi:hypothetical protein
MQGESKQGSVWASALAVLAVTGTITLLYLPFIVN